jgi:hypothetical protein
MQESVLHHSMLYVQQELFWAVQGQNHGQSVVKYVTLLELVLIPVIENSRNNLNNEYNTLYKTCFWVDK